MFAVLVGLCLSAAGCDRDPPPETPRLPVASLPAAHGIVTGVIHFDGPIPPRAIIRNEPCCTGAPPTQLDETVVVGPAGTLANVFVYIDNGPKTEGSALPAPLLDQKFCQYVPHAIGVVVGQPLTIQSDDATMHNVAISPADESAQNFAMYRAGDSTLTHFNRPGFAITKCDVHPWMKATIGVFDNPFFAVTGEDGAFKITGLPDGTYTLIARHELYGQLHQTITIRAGQPTTADFSYHPPKP